MKLLENAMKYGFCLLALTAGGAHSQTTGETNQEVQAQACEADPTLPGSGGITSEFDQQSPVDISGKVCVHLPAAAKSAISSGPLANCS